MKGPYQRTAVREDMGEPTPDAFHSLLQTRAGLSHTGSSEKNNQITHVTPIVPLINGQLSVYGRSPCKESMEVWQAPTCTQVCCVGCCCLHYPIRHFSPGESGGGIRPLSSVSMKVVTTMGVLTGWCPVCWASEVAMGLGTALVSCMSGALSFP